jgi:hypothetical protein
MPRQPRRRQQNHQYPLIFRPLSTRRSSYPTWVMMYSHSLPYAIKLSDLQNNAIVQALLGSERVLPVPRIVDDIAESLRWLLEDEVFPLSPFYKVVVTQLLLVCDWQSPFHVHPYDAHYKIIWIVAKHFLRKYFACSIFREAINLVTLHLRESWGARITFGGFKNVLMEVLEMIFNNYRDDILSTVTCFFQVHN